MIMEKEFKPLFNNVIVSVYNENPYKVKASENEWAKSDGTFENPDDGTIDQKDFFIQCAKVIEVGPECKYVKVNDDVYLDFRSLTPLYIGANLFFTINEMAIKTVIAEGLTERFKQNGD